MQKMLFFDNRELESVSGFTRRLQQPAKHPGNPLFTVNEPWENGNMQLYGSVLKVEGRPFQLWYSVIHPPFKLYLAYAESDDGIVWRKPLFDVFSFNGQKTNIVFPHNPHGPAIIYDAADPREDWRYKMVAGADPGGSITAFRSADGTHWKPVRPFPALVTHPDCPMGFLRTQEGRYVIYHRVTGFGRRTFRSETWDFANWTGEPRMVLEPGPGDPPQLQFYGMGAAPYGSYEIGTLWAYNTVLDDRGPHKMNGYQEAEFTYTRFGYAWHRLAPGSPFIPHGAPGSWEQGNLQCASQPVYLDDEIRYYYMGTTMFHKVHWELDPQTAGLGMASLKPDRFVALETGKGTAELLTYAFRPPSNQLFVNATTGPRGWLKFELLDPEARPIPGFTLDDCVPVKGDSTAHALQWRNADWTKLDREKPVRLRAVATHASLYSIFVTEPGERAVYHRFTAARG